MMQSSKEPEARSQKAEAPKGRDRIAQGEALGWSSTIRSKPHRGGIRFVLSICLMAISMARLQADDKLQFRTLRICDGRILVSIPSNWKTHEWYGWRTIVRPPDMQGIMVMFTVDFDLDATTQDAGKAKVLRLAAKDNKEVIETGGRVQFSGVRNSKNDDEAFQNYWWVVSEDRAAVMIEVRIPERWKNKEESKQFITKDIVQMIKTIHIDRPRGNSAAGKILKTTPLKGDAIYSISKDDWEMNAAIAKSQDTLAEFRQIFSEEKDTKEFLIKAKITRGRMVEYTYVNQLKITDDGFEGLVSNDSNRPEFPKKGDKVVVQSAEIADWMYVKQNRTFGNFTLRIIQERLKAKENKK